MPDNQFHNSGDGEQNIAQGDHAIGKQVNNYGISPEVFAQYVKELGATEQVIRGFLSTLLEHDVPREQWDSQLRDIAAQYKELLARLETVQSEDPQVQWLKAEARQAIEAGDYAKAENLLNQAEARDVQAIEELDKQAEQIAQATRQRRISAAATNADQARLQDLQLRYAKAAVYWQKAAALLPKESKKERAHCLNAAGYELHHIAKYKEALALYQQSLSLYQEIGDKEGEGATLHNIGGIYDVWGDYTTALEYKEQSLVIRREIGDEAGQGDTLNSIGQTYQAQGYYGQALALYQQSLSLYQKIGNKKGEGSILNNIGQICQVRGDHGQALIYLEQSLTISQEIGDKHFLDCILNNISIIYNAQGKFDQALICLEQSLAIQREIGNRYGEACTLCNIGSTYKQLDNNTESLSYLEQSLAISQEIGDRAGEGDTLNKISEIYDEWGWCANAMNYLKESLAIKQEIGDRAGEMVTSWNIGLIYEEHVGFSNNLTKAEQYISRAVQLAEEIGHPSLEKYRKALERVRAKLQGRWPSLLADQIVSSILGK